MLILKEFVAALPDLPIWLAFVFIAALAVAVMLIDLLGAAPKPPKEPTFISRGWVSELAERVKRAGQGEFFKWRLRRQLSDLTIDLIAMKHKLDQKSARQFFEAGTWTPEARIKVFLTAEPQIRPYAALKRFLGYFKLRQGASDKRYGGELENVVKFLEAYASQEF